MLSWATRKSRAAKASEESLLLGTQLGVRQWVVDRSSVNLGKKIGNGAFGTVYICTVSDEKVQEEAVAKMINPRKLSTQDVPLLKSELQIWSTVTHPNCVRFFGVCLASTEYLLLAEYLPEGTLETRLTRYLGERGPLTQDELIDMMNPLADGMRYLHSKNIIHRDLKSANILVDGERLAISDFGLSRTYDGGKKEFTAETGSYRWMAPEVTRHETYDEKCDVYSYACLAYEMVSYRKPFYTMTVLEAAFAVARDGLRPDIPPSCPDAIAGLIRKCWFQRSEERPSFEEVYRQLEQLKKPSGAESRSSPPLSATPSLLVDQLSATPSLPVDQGSAGATRSVEPKRKMEEEQAEGPNDPPAGGLKRPKSISSALVDLQVNH